VSGIAMIATVHAAFTISNSPLLRVVCASAFAGASADRSEGKRRLYHDRHDLSVAIVFHGVPPEFRSMQAKFS
jgi:hypothetical protein